MNLLSLLSSVVLLGSCTVFSVHPLYNREDLVMDQNLTGTWQDINDDNAFFRIGERADSSYHLTWWENNDTIYYKAHYLKLNNRYYLDLYPLNENFSIGDQLMRNFVPVHSFLQLELTDNHAVAWLFNGEKMMKLFRQNRIRLKHELLEDYVLITARTEDVQKFIIRYAENREVFDDAIHFEKRNGDR